MKNDDRPECCADEHIQYLDELRARGVNMYDASVHLRRAFTSMSKPDSHEILAYWMTQFRRIQGD